MKNLLLEELLDSKIELYYSYKYISNVNAYYNNIDNIYKLYFIIKDIYQFTYKIEILIPNNKKNNVTVKIYYQNIRQNAYNIGNNSNRILSDDIDTIIKTIHYVDSLKRLMDLSDEIEHDLFQKKKEIKEQNKNYKFNNKQLYTKETLNNYINKANKKRDCIIYWEITCNNKIRIFFKNNIIKEYINIKEAIQNIYYSFNLNKK